MKKSSHVDVLPTPRSSRQIREQLADLAAARASAEAYGERDAASKMTLQSLRAHEKQLQEELHAAELWEAKHQDNGAPADETEPRQ